LQTSFVPRSLELRTLDGRLLERQELSTNQVSVQVATSAPGLRLAVLLAPGHRDIQPIMIR